MKILLLSIPCVAMLCGCQANYYADKYRNEASPAAERFLLPHTGAADIVYVPMDEMLEQTAKYERAGYLVIGYSKFSADIDDYSPALRAQAQTVQADVVLSSAYNKGTRTEMGPMGPGSPTLHNMANSGGYIVSQGSRPPATATPDVNPVDNMIAAGQGNTVGVAEYRAVFMRKRAVLMGANLALLSGAQSTVDRVSHGLNVTSVVDGSPAQQAGILAGDIIVAVDDQPVNDLDGYKTLIDARAGRSARIALVRNGSEMTIPVQLNPLPKGP
jgi:hypothetical protein